MVDWRFLSLELVNGADTTFEAAAEMRSAPALRTAALLRREHDASSVGDFYRCLDDRFWGPEYYGAMLSEPDALRRALSEAGLDPGLYDKALADSTTLDDVMLSHREVVDDVQAFGVPTIRLDGGDGPAIFGPVVSRVPSDEEAVELWRHVAWLTRSDNFWELKRHRAVEPDLDGYRVRKAKAAQRAT